MNQKTVIQIFGKTGVPAGTRLNDIYEIETQIAAGGMGEIYKGKLIETGDPVAIKMIKPEFAGNESVLGLFRKEASALHHLHHDSIVRYYVFTIDRTLNRPYLAMEFVDGRSLADIVKQTPLTFEQVDKLRIRIAAGLQAAHSKGIIHRDISPDNIILPEEDVTQAKIIDFGIARNTKLGAATIIGDGFAGKYNYVSPEQLGLFGSEVTNRSDIYSLGLVLAEAIRGKPLDMSGSQADVIDKRRQVPDLIGIDSRLQPLLKWMLQPKPEDRPQSMTAVMEWVGKSASSGRTVPLVAGVGGASLLAAAAGAYFFLANPGGQPSGRQQDITSLQPPPAITQPTGPGGVPILKPAEPQAPPALPAELTPDPNKRVAVAPTEPPPEPDPTKPPPTPLNPAERASRVAQYIRYYDAPCLYLYPAGVTERSAAVDAMAGSNDVIDTFSAEFRTVNGFDAQISPQRIAPGQCSVTTFLQRLEADRDPALRFELKQPIVKLGQRAQGTIDGVGDRQIDVVLINDDGSTRNITSQLKRDRNAYTFDGRLDEGDNGTVQAKVALIFVSQKKLAALASAGKAPATTLLSSVIEEIQSTNQSVKIFPKYIRFER